MTEDVRRDDGAVWLATVLGAACLENGIFRVRYSDLYRAAQLISDDNTVPFTANGNGQPNAQSLPGFYDALLKSHTLGVDMDGESAEYVFVDSRTAEQILSRATAAMGPGYIDVARRHAKRLCDILQKE